MPNAKPSFTPLAIVVLQEPVRLGKDNGQGKTQKAIERYCICKPCILTGDANTTEILILPMADGNFEQLKTALNINM